jgi:hypothetical protein
MECWIKQGSKGSKGSKGSEVHRFKGSWVQGYEAEP